MTNQEERRDFKVELIKFLGIDPDSSINDILATISETSYKDDRSKNIVYQYLRKIRKQYPEYSQQITFNLSAIKKAKFKTFKINIADAYSRSRFEGSLEIFVNDFNIIRKVYKHDLVALDHMTRINIEPFIQCRDEDMVVDDIYRPSCEFELMTHGCGCSGCCQSLYWNVTHQGDRVIIKDIFWGGDGYKPEEKIQHIFGTFNIDREDFISEIDRFHGIYRNAAEKRGKIWDHPSKKRKEMIERRRLSEARLEDQTSRQIKWNLLRMHINRRREREEQ